ncbi:MAG: nuclease-related domain-containing protein [Actinomycetota bacterium]
MRTSRPSSGRDLAASARPVRSSFRLFGRARADARLATALALANLEDAGFHAFHDRRSTGVRTNVDHVVVGPSGLFVIESKGYSGQLQIRGGDVFVGGRLRTRAVDEAGRAADAVRRALGMDLERTRAPITSLICMHRAQLPWGTVALNGVRVVSANEMLHLMRKAPLVLHPDEVDRIARILDERFPPA